ncbi:MAG: serine hydrolase domain-containing protein [Solirubrobacteraceae bacterium]
MTALIAAAAMPANAAAASRHEKTIQNLKAVLKAIDAFNVPGYVVGVTGGQVWRFERAHGFADVQRKKKMSLNTRFRIGSISKTFTATVILRLVEKGRLHLNDPISIWEPKVPNAKRITIRRLLDMTSGIWDEGGYGPDGQVSSLIQQERASCSYPNQDPTVCGRYWRPQQLINLAIQDSQNITHGPAFPPGVWYYSDTNYIMLALIAQRVTHQPFAQLLGRLVLDPLHLRNTSFPTHSTGGSRIATGYQLIVNPTTGKLAYVPQVQPSPSSYFGAGNVVSTLHDLQIWAKALGTGELLTRRMQRLRLKLVQTGVGFTGLQNFGQPTALPVQYGLGIANSGGMLGHNGEVPGYLSEMWYLPRVHGTVVVFLNTITPCGPALTDLSGLLGDATSTSLAQVAFGGSLQRSGPQLLNTCVTAGQSPPASLDASKPPIGHIH